jgi:hypothetical protein
VVRATKAIGGGQGSVYAHPQHFQWGLSVWLIEAVSEDRWFIIGDNST